MNRFETKAALGAILALALGIRLIGLDQPIVENYVGRQIPTAMVARNLDRRSDFLSPRLDVAPLPNLFLVEPPLYAAAAVALERVTGLKLEAAGRVLSALGILLGTWGLFGLAQRRDGPAVALVAAAAFVAFPVTIRYGRAFQPDSLMLGCVVAGLRGWDEFESRRGWPWLVLGVGALACGLALKIVAAFVLIPLVLVVIRDRKPWKLALVAASLLPAFLWYLHAAVLLAEGRGSRASVDNGTIWLGVLAPAALFESDTYHHIARYLCVRAFTPIGPILGLMGFWLRRGDDRLWWVWGGAALAALAALAAKLHHEYYWLALAPAMAVGVAKAIVAFWLWFERPRRWVALTIPVVFVVLCHAFSSSTWRTPTEWRSLADAAATVRREVPPDDLIVACEALIYMSDRVGCRLEFSSAGARRAAGEWDRSARVDGPVALVEFYRLHGARFFADVVPEPLDPARLALHEAIRGRYNVVIDRPGVLLALLNESDEAYSHGSRAPVRSDRPDRAGHHSRLRKVEAAGAEDQRPDRVRLPDRPLARRGGGRLPSRGRYARDGRPGT